MDGVTEIRINSKVFKFIVGSLLVLVIFFILKTTVFNGDRRRAVSGIPEPVQTKTSGGTTVSINGYDIDIKFLYEYKIEALVVSRKNYKGNSIGDKLSPMDLALAWGDVAASNKKVNFHWKQSGRWYYWSVNNVNDIEDIGGVDGVSRQSANNHMIPADLDVEKKLSKVRVGDHILINGYLVNIDGENKKGNTFYWYSSTSRDDTGDGACEVVYVKDIQILD